MRWTIHSPDGCSPSRVVPRPRGVAIPTRISLPVLPMKAPGFRCLRLIQWAMQSCGPDFILLLSRPSDTIASNFSATAVSRL